MCATVPTARGDARSLKWKVGNCLRVARKRIGERGNAGLNHVSFTTGESTMKQLGKYLSAFFLSFALVAVVGCAGTPQREGTGEYVDDTVITTKVKAAIFAEPTLKSAEINVETFKGTVQLSGFVNSQADISKAVAVTRGVAGVKSVKNDMRLK
jgi:BON domain